MDSSRRMGSWRLDLEQRALGGLICLRQRMYAGAAQLVACALASLLVACTGAEHKQPPAGSQAPPSAPTSPELVVSPSSGRSSTDEGSDTSDPTPARAATQDGTGETDDSSGETDGAETPEAAAARRRGRHLRCKKGFTPCFAGRECCDDLFEVCANDNHCHPLE